VPEVDCAICLGTSEHCFHKVLLNCGHTFCKDCLSDHVATCLVQQAPWCPLCRCELHQEDLRKVRLRIPALEPDHVVAPVLSRPLLDEGWGEWWAARRAERRFRRTARRAHLKVCPRCGIAISKSGGCNHMTCRCGHEFAWNRANTVVPCRQVHLKADGSFSLWCETCPGCSRIARAKLVATRAGVVVSVPVVAAVTASGLIVAGTAVSAAAAITAAAPAIACAPLAAAYEPIRRCRGREDNPFKRGIGSGVRLMEKWVDDVLNSD